MREEAYRDYLTDLLNRRGFQKAMASLRSEDLPLAVCLFDLDNLKMINDTCGHDAGDRVIMAFADLLRRNTEKEDILCRYGGDEFMVIMKHVADKEAALRKANGICRLFPGCFEEDRISASCSGGIALCGEDEKPSSILLIKRADEALYRAKRENKGSCCL